MSVMTDIAFTPAVKAVQERYGTRDHCRSLESQGRPAEMDDNLVAFIETRDSAYLATASADGRPYMQHRGGNPGFIKVMDPTTLCMPDYPGNQHLITLGNLSENDRAFLFLMDYPTQQRVKLWGRAAVVDDDPQLFAALADPHLPVAVDRALRFTIEAWDINCRKFIRQRFTEEHVRAATQQLTRRIGELEAEIAQLKATA